MPYEVWLSEEAVADRNRLTKEQEKKLIWWGHRVAQDATAGDPIRKSLVPLLLKRKYEIQNLWRLELPGGMEAAVHHRIPAIGKARGFDTAGLLPQRLRQALRLLRILN